MKLSIGQVSKLFDITKDTLRHYDKLGILKPDVNKNNGYRYYSREHIDQLSLILYTRELDISLSDIKKTLQSESIDEYKNLINKQQQLITNKIESLLKIQKQLSKLDNVLDEIIEFKNEYNFDEIKVQEDKLILLKIDIKDIVAIIEQNKDEIYSDEDIDIDTIEEECLYSAYKLNYEKKIIEDEKNLYVKYSGNEELFNKYMKDNSNIYEEIIINKFIKFKFNGTIQEITDYIFSISQCIELDLEKDIYIEFNFYIPKENEDEETYFTQILINTK